MAVAFVAAASDGINANRTSVTEALDCGAAKDRYLLVAVESRADPTVSSVTYNGVGMTLLATEDNATSNWLALYGLVAPATGSNDIVASFSSTITNIAAMCFSGVHQVTPLGTIAQNYGYGTTPTVTVVSAADEIVAMFGRVTASSSITRSEGTGQTERVDIVTGFSDRLWADTEDPGAASTVMDGTTSTDFDWSQIGVGLKPSAAGEKAAPSVLDDGYATSQSATSFTTASVTVTTDGAADFYIIACGFLTSGTEADATAAWNGSGTLTMTQLDKQVYAGNRWYYIFRGNGTPTGSGTFTVTRGGDPVWDRWAYYVIEVTGAQVSGLVNDESDSGSDTDQPKSLTFAAGASDAANTLISWCGQGSGGNPNGTPAGSGGTWTDLGVTGDGSNVGMNVGYIQEDSETSATWDLGTDSWIWGLGYMEIAAEPDANVGVTVTASGDIQ